jgi:hypothetical protein
VATPRRQKPLPASQGTTPKFPKDVDRGGAQMCFDCSRAARGAASARSRQPRRPPAPALGLFFQAPLTADGWQRKFDDPIETSDGLLAAGLWW